MSCPAGLSSRKRGPFVGELPTDWHSVAQGRQLLTVMFESEAEPCRWLNDCVCIGDGAIDPVAGSAHIDVFSCISEI